MGGVQEVTARMKGSQRYRNPGKRERQAGKRHRRARVFSNWEDVGALHGGLKVGPKHLRRHLSRAFGFHSALAVADAENSGKGTEESVRHVACGLPDVAFTEQEEP